MGAHTLTEPADAARTDQTYSPAGSDGTLHSVPDTDALRYTGQELPPTASHKSYSDAPDAILYRRSLL